MTNYRVAWLLTSAVFYWQPAIANLAKFFPMTTVYTTRWLGFAKGLENSFQVELVGERKFLSVEKSETGYGNNFTYMPLKIINRLLQFKPHIIFSNAFGLWTFLALLFKPLGKWRVVIAYEGCSPSVDFRNSPHRLALRRTMVQAADAFITNSNAGKAYLTEFLNASVERVFVQPYEVPAANTLFTEDANKLVIPQTKQPVFIFVGKVAPRKGLHLLLEACAILAKQGCCDYTLQIVGDGQQRQELEEFCQKNNLQASVQWVGRVDYARLGEYFSNADVFILPTLEDTWGVVVLEAMVLGKAILCSKFAGASELVVEGENGYIFDPNNPEKVAELMRHFINNPNLAKSMGISSQQIMNQYTPEAAGKLLAEVTYKVLEAK
ncbi:MAG: glycosyltransferase family 4 protein [Scytonematopsis contorta HA4267-MV1]|jgi:glycosyltransferase involved in cell wall biosynthesis|nr:glycosyltransferase family 4 protein [Scytonematopsis contorta HA4267-MV1]